LKERSVNTASKPKVLIVYYTLTKQSGRVADAMADAFEARGCDATKVLIEFTDERWVPKLSQFPMKCPIPQIASILTAQLRHKTGEIRIPSEAAGDYDLVVLASPTWWFQTSRSSRSDTLTARARAPAGPFARAIIVM
jgi:cobalamin biosynthesis Mg chelatase CobN